MMTLLLKKNSSWNKWTTWNRSSIWFPESSSFSIRLVVDRSYSYSIYSYSFIFFFLDSSSLIYSTFLPFQFFNAFVLHRKLYLKEYISSTSKGISYCLQGKKNVWGCVAVAAVFFFAFSSNFLLVSKKMTFFLVLLLVLF